MGQADEQTPEDRRALFRVVRGAPDDAQLAALTAVVVAAAVASADGAGRGTAARDRWSDPATRLRTVLAPGPGAWRSTFLPGG